MYYRLNIALFSTLLLGLIVTGCRGNDREVLATGSFEAEEVVVSAEVSGRLLAWNVDEGDSVLAGVSVGLVDTTQLSLQRKALLSNRAGLTASAPDIATQNAILQSKRTELKREQARVQRLLQAGVATQKQLDDISSALEQLDRQIKAQHSTLQKGNSSIVAQGTALSTQIEQIDDRIERSNIQSPINGTIVASYVHVGELAVQGHPLFKVADLGKMTLKAYMTQEHLSSVRLNDKVDVYIDGAGDAQRKYIGTVVWISDRAEFTPKMVYTKDERQGQVYALKVAVANDGYIKIGMYGEVVRNK